MKKVDKGTLLKVLGHLGKYKLHIALTLILAAITVGMTLYIPILVGNAIDYIIDAGNVDFNSIYEIIVRIVVIAVATGLLQWAMNSINNKITFQVVRDVRKEAFEKIMILPLQYIDSHAYGQVVSRVIADVDQFADGLLLGFTQLFTGVASILGTLLFMLTINFEITLVVVILTPLSLFIAKFIAKRTYKMFKKQSETRGEQTAFIDEMITNAKVVAAFGREDENLEKFDEINERLEKTSLKAIFYSSITNPSTRFVNAIVYALVGLTGALAAINGSITVGGLSCFLSYANQYTKPFNEISGVVTELQNAIACARRIFEIIEEKPQIPDKLNAAELKGVEGNVLLDDVSFSYVKQRELIKNFNLKVKPGQRVAIVGPTGCGKTTIINLLMRFYDVDSGAIKVEGIDIRDMTRHSLRASYGMVLQETWLKEGTIRENIAMGKEDATDEQIIQAAKLAHSYSFIKRLPEGLNTYIMEDGGSLVIQGQKQLLCNHARNAGASTDANPRRSDLFD